MMKLEARLARRRTGGSGWALVLAAALSSFTQPREASSQADTVYLNGTVLTMDAANTVARAVAVRDGNILAVGSNADVRKLIDSDTRSVDLDGRTLLPGFIDAHGHFLIAGRNALYSVDLNAPPIGSTESVEEIVAKLKERAASTPAGQWIVGIGYDDTLVAEKRHPTRRDLDRVSRKHPIFIFHISLHFAVANSMALRLAGIDADTPQPEGGVIRREEGTGEPNGVLEEIPAFGQVYGLLPPQTEAQSLDAINHMARVYAEAGVTTAQDGLARKATIEILQEAARRGMLPIRLVIYPAWSVAQEMIDGTYAIDESLKEFITVGAAKIVGDGSIQGYTGYLSEPYHVPFKGDPSYRGYPAFSREALTSMVAKLHAGGFQLAIHGNGDAAIDDIIHAFAAAQKASPREDARPIIIHAQMARDDQLDRMKELGMIPSFFVLHTYYWGDRHRDIFMGPERAARMSPAKSSLERGLRFTIHADTPVVPMEPLKLVWSAVNRLSTSGAVIGERQRIGAMDALRAITIDAAWQNFEEDRKGSIEPGKLADLVILAEDPRLFPTRIKDIEVLETIVGGRTVFRK